MDTFVLRPKFSKICLTVVNLTVIAGLIVVVQNALKSTSTIAKEIRIAQNVVVSPLLENRAKRDKAIQEATLEERLQEFNVNTRKKYKNGVITNVDNGVKHIKMVKVYQGKPVRINVVEIDQSLNQDLDIAPTLSSSKLASRSTISTIAKKQNSIVAINGTFFKPQTGVPLGTLMINKKMYTGPIYDRVAMGFFDNGFDMARVQLNAKVNIGKREIKVNNINQPRMLSTYVIAYTPEWGEFAPPSPKYGKQFAVENGKIIEISSSGLRIPKTGYVIVAPKEALGEFAIGQKSELVVKTTPNWENVNHIISGGPYLVRNEQVYVDITEQKLSSIGGRNPRTAIGYTADGHLILVAVDGREGSSVGMTLTELAYFMKSLGCVNAMNLDGGGSTVMYVKGVIVNNPQVRGGITLSNALTVSKKG